MRPIGLWLGIPACDEELTIGWCLDALSEARLPEGTSWREWLVVDDSADVTAAVVRGWARAHPERTVSVLSSSERGGKSLALERVRQWFLERVEADDVLVLADADVEVDEAALVRLLTPFRQDPQLAVAWGTSRARPGGRRCRASRFQLELVRRMAEVAGPCAVRAEGRLVALRPQRLPGFAWRSGDVVDDLQLAEHARRSGVRVRSVADAWAWTTPAAGWTDFHRQTQRFLRSRHVQRREGTGGEPSGTPLATLGCALWRALRTDPGGGAAYLAARLASALVGARCSGGSLQVWAVAQTTKGRSPGSSSRPVWAEKVRLLVRTVQRVENWPAFLARYLWASTGFSSQGDLALSRRDGLRATAPVSKIAAWPVVEVLLGDAYRLDLLAARGLRDVAWLDVGAHVGTATLAASRALGLHQVVCVEPSPMSVQFLRRNLAANGVSADVVEGAVGAEPGWAVLREGSSASCENRLLGQNDPDAKHGKDVPVVPLRELLEKVTGSPLVVKMDCEGGEWAALGSVGTADLRNVSALIVEYHPVPESRGWSWLAEDLVGAGLRPLWHEPDPSRPGLGTAVFVRP